MSDAQQPHPEQPIVKPPQPVPVKSLKYHTHDGVEHDEGDRYLAPAEDVDNLVAQGMVEVIEKPEGVEGEGEAGRPPKPTQLPTEPDKPGKPGAGGPEPKGRGR